jgi:hypothetical protein
LKFSIYLFDFFLKIASLVGPENIYLINVGDSRAIIISNDGKVLASTKGYYFFIYLNK